MTDKESFTINIKGEKTGEDYRGVFEVKLNLSHRESLVKDQRRRELLGPKPEAADKEARNIAYVFAKLFVHITKAPSWWVESDGGVDLRDEAPIMEVLKKLEELEEAALLKLQAQKAADTKALTENP
jgi:hypothetical protein